MIDLDQYDSAKDARDHKNWLLVKALWFWLTFVMFGGICVLIAQAGEPVRDTAIAFVISGVMMLVYLGVSIAQTMLWWGDDMDGLLRRGDRWRF